MVLFTKEIVSNIPLKNILVENNYESWSYENPVGLREDELAVIGQG
jgi:hypothetical protein